LDLGLFAASGSRATTAAARTAAGAVAFAAAAPTRPFIPLGVSTIAGGAALTLLIRLSVVVVFAASPVASAAFPTTARSPPGCVLPTLVPVAISGPAAAGTSVF